VDHFASLGFAVHAAPIALPPSVFRGVNWREAGTGGKSVRTGSILCQQNKASPGSISPEPCSRPPRRSLPQRGTRGNDGIPPAVRRPPTILPSPPQFELERGAGCQRAGELFDCVPTHYRRFGRAFPCHAALRNGSDVILLEKASLAAEVSALLDVGGRGTDFPDKAPRFRLESFR